jgi:predicted helicase
MTHMLGGGNLGIHICRQLVSERWQHVLATNALTDDCYVSNKSRERGYTMPLFLHSDGAQGALGKSTASRPNLAPEFTKDIANKLGLNFTEASSGDLKRTFGPTDVLGYIYAILHAPTFRSRYFEFLRRDFPRILSMAASDWAIFADHLSPSLSL